MRACMHLHPRRKCARYGRVDYSRSPRCNEPFESDAELFSDLRNSFERRDYARVLPLPYGRGGDADPARELRLFDTCRNTRGAYVGAQ